VEAGGRRVLLAASHVQEVIRLVAFTPGAAHPASLGTFAWRGQPVEALDLAALLGVRREPALDAQIAVLATAPAVGLVLDRVCGLHERPVSWPGSGGPGLARVVAEAGGERLPLLDPLALAGALRGEGT
jgi:purine-binding chemotaxis protein CheW